MPAFLDFLSDELIFGHQPLDAGTLSAVIAADGCRDEEHCKKRLRASPESALRTDTPVDEQADSPHDDTEDLACTDERGDGKKAKKAEVARKACREKARREKINERFLSLAKLLEPGKEPKTDKVSILTDAYKYIEQVRVENSQVKQLNKFLEERVAQLEKDRGQQLYQQVLLQSLQPQMQQPQVVQTLQQQPGSFIPNQACVTGVPCGPTGSLHGLGTTGNVTNAMAAPPQTSIPNQPQTGTSMMNPGLSYPGKPLVLAGHPPFTAATGFWVPASMLDTRQDSLLRPPAA